MAQRRILKASRCEELERLVIFLVPGFDIVSGGVMSVLSIASETRALNSDDGVGVFVCGIPGDPPLLRFTRFRSDEVILGYQALLRASPNAKNVLVHVPEMATDRLVESQQKAKPQGPTFSFNILLQNIDLAPAEMTVENLKKLGRVTITTAHRAYSGDDTRHRFGCPVHHLSVWIDRLFYEYVGGDAKEKLIVISPDDSPCRSQVLAELRRSLPDYRFVVVENLRYEDYLQLISHARYSLTFGEGLDGYFAETIFSGGIGAAVYNSRFFTEEYRNLPFVFGSWPELLEQLPQNIRAVDSDRIAYQNAHRRQYDVLSAEYRYEVYVSRIKSFYGQHFPLDRGS